VRRLETNWPLVLLLAAVALELLRQALGTRFGPDRLFSLGSSSLGADCAGSPGHGARGGDADLWNSARIEHRLQEQETLLMAAKIEALRARSTRTSRSTR
jgi:hypothetical protein